GPVPLPTRIPNSDQVRWMMKARLRLAASLLVSAIAISVSIPPAQAQIPTVPDQADQFAPQLVGHDLGSPIENAAPSDNSGLEQRVIPLRSVPAAGASARAVNAPSGGGGRAIGTVVGHMDGAGVGLRRG